MKNTGRKTVKGSKTSAPMMAKATTAKVSAAPASPTREDIARRSYEIYLEQGAVDGHHEEHWLQAEKELLG